MVTVSAPWVDPQRDLPTLEAQELLVGPARVITVAHRKLLTLQRQESVSSERVAELTAELTRLDAQHDRMARGVYNVLDAGVDLADDAQQTARFEGTRDTLFPEGLQITQATYRAQAGAAQQVKERLTEQDRDFLASQVFAGRPLVEVVDAWLDTALLMGRRVDERARLADDESDDPNAVGRDDLRDARLEWIRATKSLLTMLEFTDLDEEQRHDLLASLREAEETARRRAEDDASTDEPQPEEPVDADVTEPV
jgi:hypothetical protein